MTIIVPKLNTPSLQDNSSESPTRLALPSNSVPTYEDDDPRPLHQSTTLQSALKNTSNSISLVISKTKLSNDENDEDCNLMGMDCALPVDGSTMKVISRGRRRSVDKQYRPSQPTGNNNGGGRTSARRSGRSYQNYDNNSSNGNSGADGNGEDNDDSDDDDDDEYIDDDDDEEEEEDDEEEDEDENKNEDGVEDESLNPEGTNDSVNNSIDEKVLATFGLKVPGESSVVLENAETVENSLAPVQPGTPVTLQGIICHETMGGVLVVNIKWRNKIYCGSLMDCSRHSWARPRFQSVDGSSHQGKARLGKNNGRGKGKGKGKRLRSNSVTSTNSNNHTVSPLKQKLRGRKKTISGSSVDKQQGFRSSKRKPKNDEDSDDSLRPGKRSCTMKGAPSPQPSPTLIECPEPGCEKKYKHINGLRYHQAHAHLESKNQDDDNNSDDRSSTTPSPSEEFKEPDPLTTIKNRTSNVTTRSCSDSSTSFSSIEKEASTTDDKTYPQTDTVDDSKSTNQDQMVESKDSLDTDKAIENNQQSSNEVISSEEECKEDNNSKQNISNDGEFVEVADKSTDTRAVTTISYQCTKHSVITMDRVVSEIPEVADTQEVWETVLDSGCSNVMSDDITTTHNQAAVCEGSKEEEPGSGDKSATSPMDEGQQVMITTSGINQLGIEVEDISENEEDIDPGQDIEFNSTEEMEKAVENLQSGSFVASLSTENNLQMLSSLKDPNLIFGLTNRERTIDEKEQSDSGQEPVHKSLQEISRTRDGENTTKTSVESKIQESSKCVFSSTGVAPDNMTDLPVSCSISVETLVSRSISASKHEPPLTNTDTPSSRFKYFPCRSYGDETYSETAANITNTVTTLALIRDPELIKNDSAMGKAHNSTMVTSIVHTNAGGSVEPSYTGSVGFNQDCTTSSIHSYGPKEDLKEHRSSGDIIRSSSHVTTSCRPSLASVCSLSSFSSPKSSTSTTYNTKLYSSPIETTNIDTKPVNRIGNLENKHSEEQKGNDNNPVCTENSDEDKIDEDKSSMMFVRQPSTFIPKHSRPSVPSLPVGVAHPYQYSSIATTSSITTGLSVTSSSHKGPSPTESASDTLAPKSDDLENKVLQKVLSEKHPIPVGEVGPVNVKRPAIHAGLPTIIPVGVPGLKTQSSIRQGLKPPGLEDRASTPGSLRMTSSPRSTTSSPQPLATSPRLSPKTSVPDTKPISSKHSPSSSSSSKPVGNTEDADVVIVKEECEPTGGKVSRDTDRERKTIPYETPKEQLTPEQIQLYQFHQRQMLQLAQAGIDPVVRYAYMRNFGYDIPSLASPWSLSMSPEQMKLLQQQQQHRIRAEEERMELHASKRSKEESSKAKLEKRESRSPQVMTSTPPRLERRMLDLLPGEGSRSVTGEVAGSRGMPCLSPGEGSRSASGEAIGSRGMPCIEPPDKKPKLEISKGEETDRELQKLRHKRQEEYLSKQSMQHKFTMFKQLENAGGAAKTHSIAPLLDEDYHKTQYSSTSSHSLHQGLDKGRNSTMTNDPDDSSQSEVSSRSRDTTRDGYSKAKHPRMSSERSFRPTQFQEYLQHSQTHYDPSTGQLPPLDAAGSYASSRLKDRDSPYRTSTQSTSPQSRPVSRPRSPNNTSLPISSSSTRTSHRETPFQRSPYKTMSTSPSILSNFNSRPVYRDRPSSPSAYGAYRIPTSSPSRSSVFSRADKSPPHHTDLRQRADLYSKESVNISSSSSSRSALSEASHPEAIGSPKHSGYRNQERHKDVVDSSMRPGIISNNLAVRRGDVTASMLMAGHVPPDEELLRRHSYMVYSPYSNRMMEHRQQQHEQVYAMMSSAQQNTSRADQYYGKRQ